MAPSSAEVARLIESCKDMGFAEHAIKEAIRLGHYNEMAVTEWLFTDAGMTFQNAPPPMVSGLSYHGPAPGSPSPQVSPNNSPKNSPMEINGILGPALSWDNYQGGGGSSGQGTKVQAWRQDASGNKKPIDMTLNVRTMNVGEEDDPELAAAIAASLADSGGPSASSSTYPPPSGPPPSYNRSSHFETRQHSDSPPAPGTPTPEGTGKYIESTNAFGTSKVLMPVGEEDEDSAGQKRVKFRKVDDGRVDGGMEMVLGGSRSGALSPPPARPSTPSRPSYNPSKEDTDIDKALALSMEDIRHSTPIPGLEPIPGGVEETMAEVVDVGKRVEGVPVALHTSQQAVMVVPVLLQALSATKEFREAFEDPKWKDDEISGSWADKVKFIQRTLQTARETEGAWVPVDAHEIVEVELDGSFQSSPAHAVQRLLEVIQESFVLVTRILKAKQVARQEGGVVHETSVLDWEDRPHMMNPASLLGTPVASVSNSGNPKECYHLPMQHNASHGNDFNQWLDEVVWHGGTWRQQLLDLPSVFAVTMEKAQREYGKGEVGLMNIPEEIHLDRFYAGNAIDVTEKMSTLQQRRTLIAIEEKELQDITHQKGRDVEASLDLAIAHFESGYACPSVGDAAGRSQATDFMLKNLKRLKERLAEKKKEKQESIAEKKRICAATFDIPEYKQHRYELKSVVFYSGFLSPKSYHTYIKDDSDKWWRIAQSEVTESSFAALASDATGLHYDAGPFLFLFSRAPITPVPSYLWPPTSKLCIDPPPPVSPTVFERELPPHLPSKPNQAIPVSLSTPPPDSPEMSITPAPLTAVVPDLDPALLDPVLRGGEDRMEIDDPVEQFPEEDGRAVPMGDPRDILGAAGGGGRGGGVASGGSLESIESFGSEESRGTVRAGDEGMGQ